MRTYLGERTPDPMVWFVEHDEDPSVRTIGESLAGMGLVPTTGHTVDENLRRPVGSYEWGPMAVNPRALAAVILRTELAVEPTIVVRDRFARDVVARLADEGFRLPASAVWRWVLANRAVIDHEQFLQPLDHDTSWAVLDGDPTASAVVAACEGAWREIQRHHPEVPDAVIVLGSGVERGRLVKLGHWWGGRWVADGQVRGEVLIAGEALHLEPAQVFEVLLHEAAHGINAARGVKDTSRGGRYHNERYAATAREVLLRVRSMKPYGMASTSLTTEAGERYTAAIGHLGDAMRIARQLDRGASVGGDGAAGTERDGDANGTERTSGRSVAAGCGCGRKLRMAPSTLAAGPVVCGLCAQEFTPTVRVEREVSSSPAASPVDGSFVGRRRKQIEAEHGQVADVDRPRLERQRARLAAVVAELGAGGGPDVLRERLSRIEQLVGKHGDRAPATPEQRGGLAELAEELVAEADGDALRDWYERFGTQREQPMPAASARDAERRSRLARALLRADGTLRGPDVRAGSLEIAAGDRVTATRDTASGPPVGAPGTVEVVDATTGTTEIEFATWGRLRTRLTAEVGELLRHDYSAVRDPNRIDAQVELDRMVPDVEP